MPIQGSLLVVMSTPVMVPARTIMYIYVTLQAETSEFLLKHGVR